MSQRGRGATSNRTGRFERLQYLPEEDERGGSPPPATTVTEDHTRTILARNDSPDVPFSTSINPYRGCEHGCVYCFARPTHAYLGMSPGLDFETRIVAKPRAAELLRAELRKPGYRPRPIAIGANTDPYQPVERESGITREVLEVLAECDHPVGVVTKSHRVVRDLDLLASMASRGLAHVFLSITTLSSELAQKMEPRASSPARRLDAVRELAEAEVPVGVLASPMIPALNDPELESILAESASAGASSAGYILLRLPRELRELFSEWLERHYPDKAAHVLNRIRETRDGELYRSGFGSRMRGSGVHADLLESRFRLAARRLGLDRPLPPLDVSRFRPPRERGDQLNLFD